MRRLLAIVLFLIMSGTAARADDCNVHTVNTGALRDRLRAVGAYLP